VLLGGVALVAGCGTEAVHAVDREADRIAVSDHSASVEVTASTTTSTVRPGCAGQGRWVVRITVQPTDEQAWRTQSFATRQRSTVGRAKMRNRADPESIPKERQR
jgi:hypothetical protein